jgi:hypothetical protein
MFATPQLAQAQVAYRHERIKRQSGRPTARRGRRARWAHWARRAHWAQPAPAEPCNPSQSLHPGQAA